MSHVRLNIGRSRGAITRHVNERSIASRVALVIAAIEILNDDFIRSVYNCLETGGTFTIQINESEAVCMFDEVLTAVDLPLVDEAVARRKLKGSWS